MMPKNKVYSVCQRFMKQLIMTPHPQFILKYVAWYWCSKTDYCYVNLKAKETLTRSNIEKS